MTRASSSCTRGAHTDIAFASVRQTLHALAVDLVAQVLHALNAGKAAQRLSVDKEVRARAREIRQTYVGEHHALCSSLRLARSTFSTFLAETVVWIDLCVA